MDPMNGTPPALPELHLPPDFLLCFLLADLGVHVLNGIAGQMNFVGRKDESAFVLGLAASMGAFRDQVRQKGSSAIVLAGPGDLPHG